MFFFCNDKRPFGAWEGSLTSVTCLQFLAHSSTVTLQVEPNADNKHSLRGGISLFISFNPFYLQSAGPVSCSLLSVRPVMGQFLFVQREL
jgi:hypothetical protein